MNTSPQGDGPNPSDQPLTEEERAGAFQLLDQLLHELARQEAFRELVAAAVPKAPRKDAAGSEDGPDGARTPES